MPGDGDNFGLSSGLSGSSAIKLKKNNNNNNNNSNNASQLRPPHTPEFTGATDNVYLRAPSQLAETQKVTRARASDGGKHAPTLLEVK